MKDFDFNMENLEILHLFILLQFRIKSGNGIKSGNKNFRQKFLKKYKNQFFHVYIKVIPK